MSKVDWQGEKVADCKVLLDYLHWHWRFGLYDTIDIELLGIIDRDASVLMMVGFLRYTWQVYQHSMRLPSWVIARDKIYDELIRRGEPVKQAKREMEGLMDL